MADTDPRDHLTAEDILKALQRQRPENRVIAPASAAVPDATAAAWAAGTATFGRIPNERALLPEGSPIVNRTGSLAYNGGWWTFVFDDGTDMPPLKLLPNAALESMVRTAMGTDARLRFEVSGEVTVFEGENYLLPRVAMRSTETVAVPGVAPDAAPEDVLTLLQAQQPSREALRPEPSAMPRADQRPAWPTAPEDSWIAPPDAAGITWALIPDGSPLVERPGRLIRRGTWWTFVFESDRLDCPEPPMKLLPGKSVELMVQAAEHDANGLVFIVSGLVTVCENENYLLPRIARRRIDAGNLRK